MYKEGTQGEEGRSTGGRAFSGVAKAPFHYLNI